MRQGQRRADTPPLPCRPARVGGSMLATSSWRRSEVVLGGALVAVLLACSPGAANRGAAVSAPAPAPAPSAPGAATPASPPAVPIPVRNAWTTISASTVPWWLALDAGYFRAQGLDVELQFI